VSLPKATVVYEGMCDRVTEVDLFELLEKACKRAKVLDWIEAGTYI
jgi:hypothetical protein